MTKQYGESAGVYGGTVSTGAISIQRLKLVHAIADANIGIGINIDGVSSTLAPLHSCSWDGRQYLAVVLPGTQDQTLYEIQLHGNPDASAIHDVHDNEADNARGVRAWGEVVGESVNIVMGSGRWAYFICGLVDQLRDYIEKRTAAGVALKDAVKGISPELWARLDAFGRRNKPPPIYGDAPIPEDDPYVTNLLDVLDKDVVPANAKTPRRLMFRVAEQGCLFRAPYEFVAYVAGRRSAITVMLHTVKPDGLRMTTTPEVPPSAEPAWLSGAAGHSLFSPPDSVATSASASAFAPQGAGEAGLVLPQNPLAGKYARLTTDLNAFIPEMHWYVVDAPKKK
jgi:hypothetical protein